MLKATKVQHYLSLMKARGIDEREVLVGTGIQPAQLEDPAFLVGIDQFATLVSNMMASAKEPSLGFYSGNNLSLVEMGTVGFVLATAPTLRKALSLWFSYSESMFGSLMSVTLEEDENKNSWWLDFEIKLPLGQAYRFWLEEFLMLCRYTGESLSGEKIQYLQLELMIPRPGHHEVYESYFDCPIHFNCPYNRISVSAPGLDTPIHKDSEALNEVYMSFYEQMSHPSKFDDPLINRIRNQLMKQPEQIPALSELAQLLNSSERTIRRHLSQRGTSYREIVDDFRTELSRRYLSNTALGVAEIGDLLGFADTKSFMRAFKRWTGQTAGQFRNQLVS